MAGGDPPRVAHGADVDTLQHGAEIRRRRPRVCWTDGAGPHEIVIEERALVGSAPGARVVVQDRTVSRFHAELDPRDDGLWARDLGSRNGTFVDDVRVEAGRVPPNGKLRLGGVVLTATYEGEPERVDLGGERFGPLVGRSTQMRELFARLGRIAPTDASVLVQGETGTGKELVARAIHDASPRAAHPYVIVDCAALPENLLEAELFGHAKGAFTGALTARPGAIEAADGGTVFLDEVGELPLSVQPKLLRAVESREVRRLGETQHRHVDVRFVSATHRDLQRMVAVGAFREDLYFRLAVLMVTVPPLREREGDVAVLVSHLLGEGSTVVSPDQLRELERRPWLGNVRELRNFLERARALGAQDALAMSAGVDPPKPPGGAWSGELPVSFERQYKHVRQDWIDFLEREYFRRLLERHERNVPEVAREAGVDRTYVYRLIRRHDL